MVSSIASQSLRRLRDHQRMIGDHDGRVAGAADGALDETDAVMRAGGIDAFAAPVGDLAASGSEAARKAGKPAPEISPSVSDADPARDQRQRHAALARRQRGALGRFLEIQQAEIIFPPLAHHGLFGALDRIGIEMGDLLHDLALQIAGVGRNPKARARSSPPTGWRAPDSPSVLPVPVPASTSAISRRAGLFARAEGIGCGVAIGRLFGARRAHQLQQARAGFLGRDGLRAGLAGRRFVFPLRQAAPGFQSGDGRAVRRFAANASCSSGAQRQPARVQCAGQRRKPRPRLRRQIRDFVQQRARDGEKRGARILPALCGRSRPRARARPSALGTKG